MASEQHLALLKQGVETWNTWRKNCPQIRPDLSGAKLNSLDLRGADLSGANLSRANLSRANLNGVDLYEVDLSEANVFRATLIGANLQRANITGANFDEAISTGASFREVYLSEIQLSGTKFSGASFKGANFDGVSLSGATLDGANLSEANLSRKDLSGANLSKANLSGANLSGANLSEADLSGAILTRANLSEAILTGATLHKAILTKANLSEAVLIRAELTQANLTEVDLTRANLNEANLREANLTRVQALNANFRNADFTGACIEGWHTNGATNLNVVACDYVYQKNGQQERCPTEGNFAPGGFTQLFQKAVEIIYQKFINTIDLIFHRKIDWIAFAQSLKIVTVNEKIELGIQTIDEIDKGIILVRVKLPAEVGDTKINKIKQEFEQKYDQACKKLQNAYEAQLKEKEIEIIHCVCEKNWYKQIINQENSKQSNSINEPFNLIYLFTEKLIQGDNLDFNSCQISGVINNKNEGQITGGDIINNSLNSDSDSDCPAIKDKVQRADDTIATKSNFNKSVNEALIPEISLSNIPLGVGEEDEEYDNEALVPEDSLSHLDGVLGEKDEEYNNEVLVPEISPSSSSLVEGYEELSW